MSRIDPRYDPAHIGPHASVAVGVLVSRGIPSHLYDWTNTPATQATAARGIVDAAIPQKAPRYFPTGKSERQVKPIGADTNRIAGVNATPQPRDLPVKTTGWDGHLPTAKCVSRVVSATQRDNSRSVAHPIERNHTTSAGTSPVAPGGRELELHACPVFETPPHVEANERDGLTLAQLSIRPQAPGIDPGKRKLLWTSSKP